MSHLDTKVEERMFSRQKEIVRRLGLKNKIQVIDVGGNVGQSIVGYRKLFPNCDIISFEPLPSCFAMRAAKFGKTKGIKLENMALSDREGTGHFFATRVTGASSLLPPEDFLRKKSVKGIYEFEQIKVNLGTLDSYATNHGLKKIDILKIDVQGGELGVLKGAESLLANEAIRLIHVEIIAAECYKGQSNFFETPLYLQQFGYVFWDIAPFLYTKGGRLWEANLFFASRSTARKLGSCKEEFPFN